MELFYGDDIRDGVCFLDREESVHLVKVLRHRKGDEISVIDGRGTLMTCRLLDDNPSGASAQILRQEKSWGGHPYNLTLAVCPTKNSDRYEWMVQKATEMGVDTIVPVIGEHSERKVFKTDRLCKILISAAKQSLKAKVPTIAESVSVKDFIESQKDSDSLKMIACCFDTPDGRHSVREVLESSSAKNIVVLVGPEGDFSESEALEAVRAGFVPVQMGQSRLRTETAGLFAAAAVYYKFI